MQNNYSLNEELPLYNERLARSWEREGRAAEVNGMHELAQADYRLAQAYRAGDFDGINLR